MPTLAGRRPRHSPKPLKRRGLLFLEELETRALPSSSPWPTGLVPVAATGANITLDKAQTLAALGVGGQLGVTGTIGNGPAGAADVAFYDFTLTQAASVNLTTLDPAPGQHLNATLSLYDTDSQDPFGYHLLAQNDGGTQPGTAAVSQVIGAGTYYVAVSGAGTDYFNPFLVGSGYAGATGAYGLLLTAGDAGVQVGDAPTVLAAAANATNGNVIAGTPLPVGSFSPGGSVLVNATTTPALTASPFLVRVELSDAIDPGTLAPDANVVLYTSATGDFTNPANFTQVYGLQVNFDGTPGGANELQVTPPGPLAPGYYQLVLLGNAADAGGAPILDANDVNGLGTNAANPGGQDFSLTFQVTGAEGVQGATGADDTPATAHQLGSIAGAGLQQVGGVLGDDPTDANGFDPSTVDLYHFQVTGSGSYAFGAEVFAQRIGTSLGLDPSLTLFKQDPTTGHLIFVTSNANTNNSTTDDNGIAWLANDAVLFAPLTAGDYFVAVSSGHNVPLSASDVGANGIFNPEVSHSGSAGNSTGSYVLNLEVQPASYPPHVVATSIAAGATLNAPPSSFTVQFDRPVNIQQLAAGSPTGNAEMGAVFVQDAAGNNYYPTFVSYAAATNQASFMFMNALPDGSYTLHFSGSQGLTDLAGDPLVGSDPTDPTADYVVPFTVAAPPRGSLGNPTAWLSQDPNNSLAAPQVVGVLFPNEVHDGVSFTRTSGPTTDTADYFQFTTLVQASVQLQVTAFQGQAPKLTLYANGALVPLLPEGKGIFTAPLSAGTYVLGVSWSAGGDPETYKVSLSSPEFHENATPLTSGPAPALSLSLVSNAPPPVNPPILPPIVPPVDAPVPPAPLPSVPVVVAPTPPAVVPPLVADPGATSVLTVSIGTPALATLATTTAPAGPTAPAGSPLAPAPILTVSASNPVVAPVVAVPTAPVSPGIPSQLALALSEGPVGGVRGQGVIAGDPTRSAPGTGAALVLLTTPLFGSPTFSDGGDSGPAELVSIVEILPAPALVGSGGFVVPNVEWVLTQPAAVVQMIAREGAATVAYFDRWLAYNPAPQPTLSDPLAAPSPVAIADLPVAEFVEAPSSSWTESLAYRPFWWGATLFLTFVFGGLHGQKWLARRQRPVGLRGQEPAV